MPFVDADSNYKNENWNTGISIGLALANLMLLDIFIYFQLWVLFQNSQDGYDFFFYKYAIIFGILIVNWQILTAIVTILTDWLQSKINVTYWNNF